MRVLFVPGGGGRTEVPFGERGLERVRLRVNDANAGQAARG
jgi:hypothetical protein